MPLPGALFGQLRDALVAAFPSEADLGAMVRIRLDQNLEGIAGRGALDQVAFQLVSWADATGSVARLFDAALAQAPNNPALLALRDAIDAVRLAPGGESDEAISNRLLSLYLRRNEQRARGASSEQLDAQIDALRRRLRQGEELREHEIIGDGRFLLVERVGTGSLSVVWRARDLAASTAVAVKVLRREHRDRPTEVAQFQRLATTLERLASPRMLRLVAPLARYEGFLYYVVEYVEGRDLARAVSEKRLPSAEALRIVLETAEGVHTAHERGAVHGRLRPSTILLAADNSARLANFLDEQSVESPLRRTPYLAPEVAEGGVPGPASDVYSLALLTLFAVTRQDPAGDTTWDEPTVRAYSTCPEPLIPVIVRAAARDPAARYPSALEFRAALVAALAATPAEDLDRPSDRARLYGVLRSVAPDASAFAQLLARVEVPAGLLRPLTADAWPRVAVDLVQACAAQDGGLRRLSKAVGEVWPDAFERFGERNTRELATRRARARPTPSSDALFEQLCTCPETVFEEVTFRLSDAAQQIPPPIVPLARRARALLREFGGTGEEREWLATLLEEGTGRPFAPRPLRVPADGAGAVLLHERLTLALETVATMLAERAPADGALARLAALVGRCDYAAVQREAGDAWLAISAHVDDAGLPLDDAVMEAFDEVDRLGRRLLAQHAIAPRPAGHAALAAGDAAAARVRVYLALCEASPELFADALGQCGVPAWALASADEPQARRALDAIGYCERWLGGLEPLRAGLESALLFAIDRALAGSARVVQPITLHRLRTAVCARAVADITAAVEATRAQLRAPGVPGAARAAGLAVVDRVLAVATAAAGDAAAAAGDPLEARDALARDELCAALAALPPRLFDEVALRVGVLADELGCESQSDAAGRLIDAAGGDPGAVTSALDATRERCARGVARTTADPTRTLPDPFAMYDRLRALEPAAFDRVIERLALPPALLPARTASIWRRAQDVRRLCECAPGGLGALAAVLGQ